MSYIDATNDFDSGWVVTAQDLKPYDIDLYIGFTGAELPISLDNVTFGYTLTAQGSIVQEATWPPEGTQYRSTDQSYVVCDRLHCKPNVVHILDVWAKKGDEEFNTTYEFVGPVPSEPDEKGNWGWDDSKEAWVDSKEDWLESE